MNFVLQKSPEKCLKLANLSKKEFERPNMNFTRNVVTRVGEKLKIFQLIYSFVVQKKTVYGKIKKINVTFLIFLQ